MAVGPVSDCCATLRLGIPGSGIRATHETPASGSFGLDRRYAAGRCGELEFQAESSKVLLLLWLAVIIPIVGLNDFTPCSQRYVATAPAAAILIGFSLGKLSDKR
jgi:hypothetical protein